jgi:hypothetical protein
MKRLSGVIGSFGSHCRSINVFYHNTKTIYEIPLYGESLYKHADFYLDKNHLCITLNQEPTALHSTASSLHSYHIDSELLAEIDKYSGFHQRPSREMK